MNSLEWNKLAFAIVVSGLVMGASSLIGQHVVKADPPSQPILVPSGEKKSQKTEGNTMNELIAKGDVQKGQALAATRCGVCHTFTADENNTVGPALYNIYMRPIANRAGYDYSDALKKLHALTWDNAALSEWLKSPMIFASGTKMVFAGIHDDQDRADIIAYLRSLSPSSPTPDKH